MTACDVVREPVDPDDRALGGPNRYGAEYFVFVGKVKVGGTYFCAGDTGRHWASWGVGGLSLHHRTREDAEAVQVAAYRAGVCQCALDRVARARDADWWCWK